MAKSSSVKKKSQAEKDDSKLLANVPYDKGFHFFIAIGHYTWETATSLATLVRMLQVIDVDSINFSF